MFGVIANYVIQKLNNSTMHFNDDRGKTILIAVSDMSWDNNKQQLEKKLSVVKSNERIEQTIIESMFFIKATVLLAEARWFSIDDVNNFLEVIKPDVEGGIYVTPIF